MAGWTNKGKWHVLNQVFQAATAKTNYYVALIVSGSTAPGADTNTLGEMSQIATGNGYSDGGYSLTPGYTDWDSVTEDDTGDSGKAQIKDVVWTASGGSIPSSGSGARWAVLTDDNATIGSREVYAYWDLSTARSVSTGQTLTLQNCELDLNES